MPSRTFWPSVRWLDRLPDNAGIDEIIYRLYVVDKLRKSREAVAGGQVVNHHDLKHDIEQW